MHIDHKTRYAATSASFCVRSSVGTLAVCCGLLGASAAIAGPRDEARPVQPMREMLRAERMQQRQLDPRQAEPRQFDPRSFEGRAEEQRRLLQENGHNADHRGGRLTPDERRDLRRQINEVGQDIYANPPHR